MSKKLCSFYLILPIIAAPTAKNGGAHPNCNKTGNTRLPNIAPDRPIIIVNEMVIVLKVVGKRSTTTASTTFILILPSETKMHDKTIVITVFWAKYKHIALKPETIPKISTKKY